MTAAEPEFGENQLAGQTPVAHGVKCHVSYDMARSGNGVGRQFVQQAAVGHWLFQGEENILFRLRAEACDSRW